MAAALKHLIDGELVAVAARQLQRVAPDFDGERFCRLASGLQTLELKARAMHVADALEASLPADFFRAAEIVEAALATPSDPDVPDAVSSDDGLRGWIGWPLGEFVVRRGLAHPERALLTLHALTQRFTAEFAIRPFLQQHPERVFATLQRWTRDPSAHVRRLVSEGSRPRLPWGIRLQSLVADPSATLPLLAALQDDASGYVRRSVANHLNDIGKDHPEVVARWLRNHLPAASDHRRALLRHASRSLIKQGDLAVLRAWGLAEPYQGNCRLDLDADQLAIGAALTLRLSLQSTAAVSQRLAIDYRVHHRKANGSITAKVFKGWQIELAAGDQRVLTRRHSFKPITTRVYYPGEHHISVQINGSELAKRAFELRR